MEASFVSNDTCSGIDGVIVVVDVLRAFSFAAYALDAGAERIILMDDLDETLRLAGMIPGALAAKDGVPAEGFDLFNSPGQLLERSDLAGRTIVQRTGAGTVGAVAAREADHLFCASFVVAEATVDSIRCLDPESVTFVIPTSEGNCQPTSTTGCCSSMCTPSVGGDRGDGAGCDDRVGVPVHDLPSTVFTAEDHRDP